MMDALHYHDIISKIKLNGESYIKIPSLSIFPELVHGFTTRFGGVSKNEYATLNLNYNKNDDPENVRNNFEILGKKLGIEPDNMVLSHQVHDKNILLVNKDHGGMGVIRKRDYSSIDSLITNETNLLLITQIGRAHV